MFSAQKAKILFHEGASPLEAMRPGTRPRGKAPTSEPRPQDIAMLCTHRTQLTHPEERRPLKVMYWHEGDASTSEVLYLSHLLQCKAPIKHATWVCQYKELNGRSQW